MPAEAVLRNYRSSLGACFVEGDGEERSRERTLKRRALGISVVSQAALVIAMILVPLLAKTPLPDTHALVPIPPYRPYAGAHRAANRDPQTQPRPACRFCFSGTSVPRFRAAADGAPPTGREELPIEGLSGIPGPLAGIDVFDARRQPAPPEESARQRSRVRAGGDVQAALLVHRVDPVYPPLMQQIRKGGRVQLHAVISTDGAVLSLEVVSGDPGFYPSALAAVRQWRYRPTILNGQPVEVETIITVIYNIGG